MDSELLGEGVSQPARRLPLPERATRGFRSRSARAAGDRLPARSTPDGSCANPSIRSWHHAQRPSKQVRWCKRKGSAPQKGPPRRGRAAYPHSRQPLCAAHGHSQLPIGLTIQLISSDKT